MRKPIGGVRGRKPEGSSGRWNISDVARGRAFQPIIATGGTVTDVIVNDV